MKRKNLVNIVCQDNGSGLSVDASIIGNALSHNQFDTLWLKRNSPKLSWLRAKRFKIHNIVLPKIKVNLFLENIWPQWIPFAEFNILIPNPEWIKDEDIHLLERMDAVVCKTLAAAENIHSVHRNVQYSSFSSPDKFTIIPAAGRPVSALHIAGRSPYKGTKLVLDLWMEHPEWPKLTIVQRRIDEQSEFYEKSSVRPNIDVITGFVEDIEITRLQQQSAINLAPSSIEGFGHSIVEAMSAGAIVITTDAPPMNELVKEGRGILVAAQIGNAVGLTNHYHVISRSLEAAIEKVLTLSQEERLEIGISARQWYLLNNIEFSRNLNNILSEVIKN